MNNLQRIAALVGETGKAQAGRTVSIKLKSLLVEGIIATVEQKEYEVISVEQFVTSVVSYDWTFVKADLDAAGIVLRSGAILTETLSGTERKYEAMELGSKEAVEDLDTSGVLVLLHTKRIE